MKVHRSSCDVHVILATFESQFNYLCKFPVKSHIIKPCSMPADMFHADGQTDIMKLIVAFRSSAHVPKHRNC